MPNHPSIPSVRIIGAGLTSPSPAGRVGEGERALARVGTRYLGALHPHPLAPGASRLPLKGEGLMILVAGDVQVAEDIFQHAVRVHQDVVVPIADHLIAMRFDDRRAFGVGGTVGMLPAVEFDGDARGSFGEVDDEIANGELPGEFVSAELFAAQTLPEAGFGVGRRAAELSCDRREAFVRHRSVHPHPTLPLKGEGYYRAHLNA